MRNQIFNNSPPEIHNHNGFLPIPPPPKQNMNFHNNFLNNNNKDNNSLFSRIGPPGQMPPQGNFQMNQPPPMINPFNHIEFKGNIPTSFVNGNGSFKGKSPIFPSLGMSAKNGEFLNALKNNTEILKNNQNLTLM